MLLEFKDSQGHPVFVNPDRVSVVRRHDGGRVAVYTNHDGYYVMGEVAEVARTIHDAMSGRKRVRAKKPKKEANHDVGGVQG